MTKIQFVYSVPAAAPNNATRLYQNVTSNIINSAATNVSSLPARFYTVISNAFWDGVGYTNGIINSALGTAKVVLSNSAKIIAAGPKNFFQEFGFN